MIWLALGGAFVSLCLAAWAFFVAVSAVLEARAAKRAIGELIDILGAEDKLRSAVLVAQAKEVEAMRSHLAYLRHKIEDALRLYEESSAIDGPLGSKRVQ